MREALALWRGAPLADVALVDYLQIEIRRLEELRLLALMERIDADLVLGAGAELIERASRFLCKRCGECNSYSLVCQ